MAEGAAGAGGLSSAAGLRSGTSSRRSSGPFVYEGGVWKEGSFAGDDDEDDEDGLMGSGGSFASPVSDLSSPAYRARRAAQEQALAQVAASGCAPGDSLYMTCTVITVTTAF